MVFLKSLVLLFSLAVPASALATPHAIRHVANHHAIAARVAAPAPLDLPSPGTIRKRQNTKRCKQRSSSASGPTPSAAAAIAAAPSSAKPAPATTIKHTPTTTHKATPTTTEEAAPTTTKEAAPTTTKDVTTKAAPTTKPTPAPSPTTTKPAPAPTTTKASGGGNSNLPSFMVGTQTGQGTFYATGLGACGIVNTDTDHIAAVSHLLFDNFPGYDGANPNNNPMCGRKVTAHYQGKSVSVTLTDRCTGCAVTDLDFSPSAFNELADFAVGRISGMTWTWN